MYMTCSATETALAVAVINKFILLFFKYFKSTLSTPTPCLEITFRFLQFFNRSSFNFTTLNVTPSNFGKTLIKFSLDISLIIS